MLTDPNYHSIPSTFTEWVIHPSTASIFIDGFWRSMTSASYEALGLARITTKIPSGEMLSALGTPATTLLSVFKLIIRVHGFCTGTLYRGYFMFEIIWPFCSLVTLTGILICMFKDIYHIIHETNIHQRSCCRFCRGCGNSAKCRPSR